MKSFYLIYFNDSVRILLENTFLLSYTWFSRKPLEYRNLANRFDPKNKSFIRMLKICLFVKFMLKNQCGSNGIRTHNHFVRKPTVWQMAWLASLAKWLSFI